MAVERRLRVLMTADTVGGVWQYAIELARALAAQGDEVTLASMGGHPSAEQRAEADAIPGLSLRSSGYRLMWMAQPWDDVERAGRWLQALAEGVQPDVVHLNDYAHGTLAWNAPVLMVGHSCVLSWWRAVHGSDAPPEWQRYRQCVQAGLAAADHVVAPTQAMLGALAVHYGPLASAEVIANGRGSCATPAIAREDCILAAGRVWDEAKNLSALTDVAPRLPWPLRIAGEATHPDGGRAILANVELLGHLPEPQLRAWMARAAIYALPARYEPFGLSVLEAAQAGCALVLGDIPSLREVWGDAAVYVAPEDRTALEHALRSLIEEAPRRHALGQRARQRAARYTPQAMATRYRHAYLRLIDARRARNARPATSLATTGACA